MAKRKIIFGVQELLYKRQEGLYRTTSVHLTADHRELIDRVTFELAKVRGRRSSVCALPVEIIDKNRKALELGKMVR